MTVPLPRTAALAAAVLVALAACGAEGHGAGRSCAAAGSPPGLSVAIPAPHAARTASAYLRVCWGDTCRHPRVELRSSAMAVSRNCDADAHAGSAACAAAAAPDAPDARKFGFARVADLPTSPVKVTLRLRDSQGRTFLDRRIELVPEPTRPNGPRCGDGAPQAGLTIVHGELTVL